MRLLLFFVVILLITGACSTKQPISQNEVPPSVPPTTVTAQDTAPPIIQNNTPTTPPAPTISDCDCGSLAFTCENGTCVPHTCSTDADCQSPNVFYCVDGLCKPNPCKVDFDCYDSNPLTSDICDSKTRLCKNKMIKQVCVSGDNYCSLGCNDWKLDTDCGGVPKEWDFVASNDPEEYLGDLILTERPSDWKEYVPLKNKVSELTANLNTDAEKAKAIADWVKRSHPYSINDFESVANKGGSVIDIFQERNGVCMDAAVLLTAMLRVAGIPARAIMPAFGYSHAYTEAYIEGKWMGIDATFNVEGDSGAYFIDETTTPNDFSTITYTHISVGTTDSHRTDELTLTSARFLESKVTIKSIPSAYGYVIIPLTGKRVFTSTSLPLMFSENFTVSTPQSTGITCGLLAVEWDCDYYSCRKSETTTPKSMFSPGFSIVGNSKNGYTVTNLMRNGYLRLAYPSGAWRVSCGMGSKDIAYKDITITPGGTVKVTPDSIEKYPQVSDADFELLISLLHHSVEGLD